ncbi:MAG: xanthine dehydrogenase family protein subunit M [Acidobacteria bacterium]|nr:xanthine dehydrogenase family protein subunit M [Acidobacteriota bacterium]
MLSPFFLEEPTTVAEASSLLARHGESAKILAGGTELLLVLKERLATFERLVHIKGIPGLAGISLENGKSELRIGALCTHRALEKDPLIRSRFPLIAEAERQIANVRVRASGTLGGNLCFAEPHADPGTFLLALGARLVLQSARGSRTLGVSDFFVDYFETVLEPDEIMTEIRVPPLSESAGWSYHRYALLERPSVAVCVLLEPDPGGRHIRSGAISLGCVAPTPVRATEAEKKLVGMALSEVGRHALEIGREAAKAGEPLDDLYGSADYKRELVAVFVKRGLVQAAARMEGAKR